MMDPNGAISYWNLAAERIFGYSAQEALGENLHDLLAPERYHAD
jgi:PAS domain S-box-containing protein